MYALGASEMRSATALVWVSEIERVSLAMAPDGSMAEKPDEFSLNAADDERRKLSLFP